MSDDPSPRRTNTTQIQQEMKIPAVINLAGGELDYEPITWSSYKQSVWSKQHSCVHGQCWVQHNAITKRSVSSRAACARM